jgi:hypothetical protein
MALRLRRNPSLVEDGASVRFLGAGAGSPLTTIGRGAALAECLDLVAAKPVTVADMCAHLRRIDPQLGDAEVAAGPGAIVDNDDAERFLDAVSEGARGGVERATRRVGHHKPNRLVRICGRGAG